MRLNEFQAHVVRSEPISGFIDTEIVAAIERSVADMLIAAARLAQSAGTDLDSIAYDAVQVLQADAARRQGFATDAEVQRAVDRLSEPATTDHHPV